MDGGIDGWMEGLMNGWRNEWIEGWMDMKHIFWIKSHPYCPFLIYPLPQLYNVAPMRDEYIQSSMQFIVNYLEHYDSKWKIGKLCLKLVKLANCFSWVVLIVISLFNKIILCAAKTYLNLHYHGFILMKITYTICL